jgi:L-ascorbate metabolism protein UlaG (beta-lactamase superfamily)
MKFANIDPAAREMKTIVDLLKWRFQSERKQWPSELTMDHVQPDLATPQTGVRVTMINHATLLVQTSTLTVLTDPVMLGGLAPFHFIKRFRKSGLTVEQLPQLDCILLSHNHYDHLDMPTMKAIFKRQQPKILLPLEVGRYLPQEMRRQCHEMDWWDTHALSAGNKIHFVPAQHWSKRTPWDTNETLWGGFVIDTPEGKVFFAGDTGYASHFSAIRERIGHMDISLLPIGAYEPRWFMKMQHMNPDDSVQAHLDLESRLSLGIHYGTFRLTDEGIDDPVHDLAIALQRKDVSAQDFYAPKNGQSIHYMVEAQALSQSSR